MLPKPTVVTLTARMGSSGGAGLEQAANSSAETKMAAVGVNLWIMGKLIGTGVDGNQNSSY
jgi:hypothetical protein